MFYNNNSRIFAIIIFVILLLNGCGSKPKIYHVGILSGLDIFTTTTDGFKEKMTELGYVEGKNIIYDVRNVNFDIAAYQAILKKFVAGKVDLIFVFPTEASLEAKAATDGTGIPVIFANSFTEDTGLVKSIREPGGNITGVCWVGADIALQRFETLLEIAPKTKRMIIIYQRGYPIVKSQLDVLRPAAAKAGITLLEIPADNAAEIKAEIT